jgi:hypothetical protein
MQTLNRQRGFVLGAVPVLAGTIVGMVAASTSLAQGFFPRICTYCYTFGEAQVCDSIVCWGGTGCTGQVCPNAQVVRACCGSACPEDDWAETCDDES